MAIACPVDLDTLRLRQEIQSIYARVAVSKEGTARKFGVAGVNVFARKPQG